MQSVMNQQFAMSFHTSDVTYKISADIMVLVIVIEGKLYLPKYIIIILWDFSLQTEIKLKVTFSEYAEKSWVTKVTHSVFILLTETVLTPVICVANPRVLRFPLHQMWKHSNMKMKVKRWSLLCNRPWRPRRG